MTSGRTQRVGAKGQVVIPIEVREQLGIQPGDQMRFWIDGDHLAAALTQSTATDLPLRGRFAGSELTGDLKKARAEERAREQSA